MDLVSLFLYALPAYLGNGAPVLFGGGAPLDGKRNFSDGQRLFGDGKTITGFFSGIGAGLFTGLALALLVPSLFVPTLSFSQKLVFSFLLALGTMAGDLLGSFIKRRMNMASGQPFFLTDQLLFIVMALLFGSILFAPPVEDLVFLFVLTFVLHVATNIIAHRLNLKKVPW